MDCWPNYRRRSEVPAGTSKDSKLIETKRLVAGEGQDRPEDDEENVRHPLSVIPTKVEESLTVSAHLTLCVQRTV